MNYLQRGRWDHAIELKTWVIRPHAGKIYNLMLDEQKQLQRSFLTQNLKSVAVIHPSKLSMAAPFFSSKEVRRITSRSGLLSVKRHDD